MNLRKIALATAVATSASAAMACDFTTDAQVKSLSAGFEAWKVFEAGVLECAPNAVVELDQEFRTKQPAAFAANPSLYHIGGVSNGTLTPLLDQGTIRPLNDLVEKYGQSLKPNQLISIDGNIMAVGFMVNTQHMMYREDIFADLGIREPKTYSQVLAAAAKIRDAGVVEYPLGGTYKAGWNLAQEFNNMYLGFGGEFFDGNDVAINNEAGVKSLEMMKALTEFMDPEYLVSDSTYVQKQFQQEKIAMANLWASRGGAMNNAEESNVVGKVKMAAAPLAMTGGKPATTLWWDGFVIAKNISDAEAEIAFQLAVQALNPENVAANNDAAVWLADGFTPGPVAQGAIATAQMGAAPYPSSVKMGLLHTALGNNIADFLTGAESAEATLADIEAAYRTAATEKGLL